METLFNIVFWLFLSFMAAHYTLGVMTMRDPWRTVLAAAFALFFVLLTRDVIK